MVKRWPIRTKLIIALTLLSAVVLLLASSGLWGLYQYRKLANSISQRAVEIPLANDLSRLALTIRESHIRSSEIDNQERMIETSSFDPLFDIAALERDRFTETLLSFDLAIRKYQTQIQEATEQQSLLVDTARQQRSLGEIRASFDSLEEFLRAPLPLDFSRRAELEKRLDGLVDQTNDHLTAIHTGMAEFSTEVRGKYRTSIGIAWVSIICALLIVVVFLIAFRSLVVKPFRTLIVGSRLVAGGEFHHVIDLGTDDELSELASAMNDMTRRFRNALQQSDKLCAELDHQVRERTREVIQNEQLASVGFLAAGVAHEINNPLATIAWSAESLQSRLVEMAGSGDGSQSFAPELTQQLSENLRRIEDEAYRCKGITEKLLDFSRLSEIRRAKTDLVELVHDVVAMVSTVGKFRCKTIHVDAPEQAFAHVNPQEIRQVVLNLVTNALESVDTNGAVTVSVKMDDNIATVVVQDDGCGMTQEVMQHLFEPFFTRRRDGTGTGLGLSITYRIVSQHGGSLIPYSDGEGCGSRMEMSLPISPECEDNLASHRFKVLAPAATSHAA
ncbi:ATP-binding protein [Rubripirellula amarantea]|nr:ATP-binding protein [Rubripirellula amarantea]